MAVPTAAGGSENDLPTYRSDWKSASPRQNSRSREQPDGVPSNFFRSGVSIPSLLPTPTPIVRQAPAAEGGSARVQDMDQQQSDPWAVPISVKMEEIDAMKKQSKIKKEKVGSTQRFFSKTCRSLDQCQFCC